MNLRSIVAVLTLFAAVACSEPLEFADWTIPVPEGTRIIEYAGVPLDERAAQMEVVEDLKLGGQADDPNQRFYRARDLAVDDAGRIYVLDSGNQRVQVFNADGTFDNTFGRQGAGPGEFTSPSGIAITGDNVIVNDSAGARLSMWSLDGQHLADVRTSPRPLPPFFYGAPDGSIVTNFSRGAGGEVRSAAATGSLRRVFGRVFIDGRAAEEYANLAETFINPGRTAEGIRTTLFGVSFGLAASVDGEVYATAGDEYQVVAYRVSGEPRWALRVAWPRRPYGDGRIEEALEFERLRTPDAQRSELIFAEYAESIAALRVDGGGRLFVFLYEQVSPPSETNLRPIDIYSAAGELLFAGRAPIEPWHAAHEESVYRLASDPDTEEQIVIRYRFVEPFE